MVKEGPGEDLIDAPYAHLRAEPASWPGTGARSLGGDSSDRLSQSETI